MKETGPAPDKALHPLNLGLLSVLVGALAGLGAIIFRTLIAFFHNLFFLRRLSLVYDANIHTPASPWGVLVILVPVVGAAGVAFLVKNFAPEAKGTGIPEVIDSVYYKKGIIRPMVAVFKAMASSLSLGSGGSVGREGPIVQIGATFGSATGQVIRMPAWQRITLITAGTAGGIAATFNTPVGGVLFAIEVLLHEVNIRTLVPISIASVTATFVGRMAFGNQTSFLIKGIETPYITSLPDLIAYVGLGLVMGLVSALFIKSVYGFGDFFDKRLRGNYYTRHMSGMLVVGVTFYLMMRNFGHYYVEGVGYATIQDILGGTMTQLTLLLLLFALKLGATSLALGSGASGGIFSPALYVGATVGGIYGTVLNRLLPGMVTNPIGFAVAGMAGMIGGTTGTAMAAVVMITEMTRDYDIIVPMFFTVVLSYGIRKILFRESIYTERLARRGHFIPDTLQANVYFVKQARDIMTTNFVLVPAARPLKDFVGSLAERRGPSLFLVEDNNVIVGVTSAEDVLEALAQPQTGRSIGDIAGRDFIVLTGDAALFDVVARMRAGAASLALVVPAAGTPAADQVLGIITRAQISDSLAEGVSTFPARS
jgi:CIC family chloride channel protein